MDLQQWIKGQHGGIRTIFESSVIAGMEPAQLLERPDAESNSIAWLIWHLARCEDVAINAMVRGVTQVMESGDWSNRLNVRDTRIGTGMTDEEVGGFGKLVDCAALLEYWQAVQRETGSWVGTATTSDLDDVPDVPGRLATLPAVWGEQASWVRALWSGRPASFFLGWVTIGHGYVHLGEMMAVRTRLGMKGL